jgi:hypothetical protein
VGEESNVFLIPPRLLLAFVEFHVYHHPIVADGDGPSSLSVTLSHLEELTLSYWLSAAYVYKNTKSL